MRRKPFKKKYKPSDLLSYYKSEFPYTKVQLLDSTEQPRLIEKKVLLDTDREFLGQGQQKLVIYCNVGRKSNYLLSILKYKHKEKPT